MFKVGDRVRWKYGASVEQMNNGITVTEITENGFKWKLDKPVCIHPLFGSYSEGECLDPTYYELIPPCDHAWNLVMVKRKILKETDDAVEMECTYRHRCLKCLQWEQPESENDGHN